MKKLLLLTAAALALLAAPVASFAQLPAWTSPCSAGATIDEASLGLYAVGSASLLFAPGMTGTVVARYDVTNTAYPPSPMPPWTTMQLGYFDPPTPPGTLASVTAILYRVHMCDGTITAICGPITSTDSSVATCKTCTITEPIDFTNYLYYVYVTVYRNTAVPLVKANTLRIY